MKKIKNTASNSPRKKLRPAVSQEARDNQMIALAYDVAEQQMLDGTASSQVITHFLKLGTAKYQYETEKLRGENALIEAKTDAIASAARVEELYTNALNAMKSYNGNGGDDEYADI